MAREVTRFVILAAPRTGSNWLCTLLNSHPDILCHHELFNPKGIHYALNLRDGVFSLGTLEERERDPLGLLRRVWAAHLGHSAVGFKLNLGQNEAVIEEVFGDTGIRKILISRRNRIKTFVSELIAQTTGQWESYPGRSKGLSDVRVQVELPALFEHIRRNEHYYARLRGRLEATGRPYLQTEYEKLESDEERERILQYLGVTPSTSQLKAGSFKRNPRDMREIIVNYAEVEAAVRGTEFEAELSSLSL